MNPVLGTPPRPDLPGASRSPPYAIPVGRVTGHVRLDQGLLQANDLRGIDAETHGSGGDAVPAGDAAFVIGAGMAGEVMAPLQELQQARTGSLHPRVRRPGRHPRRSPRRSP